MNSSITATAAAAVPMADLPTTLFNDFISFIDRSEKTARTYIVNLRQFAAWLKYRAIARPVRQDILSYRDYLAADHEAIQWAPEAPEGWQYRTDSNGNRQIIKCKPNTIAQYLRSVAQFFRWTAASGFYPDIAANIHAPKIRHDTHRKEALTAAEVLTIEQHITAAAEDRQQSAAGHVKDTAGRIQRATEQGARLLALYTLAVNAGLRTIELSRANIKDLEVKNGKAVLYIWGKGHTEPDARKALAPEVYQTILDYLRIRSDRPTANSPLFVSTGNRSGGQRIATTTISTMLKKAMQQAGFNSERLTAHSLRHTAGTAVQEITGNLYQTQQYMRHSNPATTEIYLHCDTERQEEQTAGKLYDYFHGTQQAGPDPDGLAALDSIAQGMTAEQLRQLVTVAAAMAR